MHLTELPAGVEMRLWQDGDDVSELTDLLHRAYAPLAARGMQYVATWQGDDITRRRIADRDCWVLIEDGRVIGTVTLTPPRLAEGCDWYDRVDVATFGQFAVDPDRQGRGLGAALLAQVEHGAAEVGAAELALDTSVHAHELIGWYARRGYREVGRADWPSTNYESVVLSKTVGMS